MDQVSVVEEAPPPLKVWPDQAPLSVQQRATFPLPEGLAALELPSGNLSKESYEDLRAWIDVMLRRAQRAARVASEPKKTSHRTQSDADYTAPQFYGSHTYVGPPRSLTILIPTQTGIQ